MSITKLNGLEDGMAIGQKINEIIDGKADVNADTTGNAGTATKLETARTISLTGDITGSTTFDGSANKSITTTLGNTTKIDGQWVSSTKTLSTATAVGTYTIDLSDYLPNDNYNYEVLINCTSNSNSSTLTDSFVYSDIVSKTTYSQVATSTNGYYCRNMFSLPVNKYIYFQNEVKIGGSGTPYIAIIALAYRRIGSNT